jgi:hypothetical protein
MIASNSIRRFKNFLVRMCHATFWVILLGACSL